MARCQRRHAPHAASPFSRDRRPGSEHTGNALASFRQPLTAGQHRTSTQLMLHKRTACFTHNRKTIKKVGSVFPLGLKSPSSRCSLRCKCLRHSNPSPKHNCWTASAVRAITALNTRTLSLVISSGKLF